MQAFIDRLAACDGDAPDPGEGMADPPPRHQGNLPLQLLGCMPTCNWHMVATLLRWLSVPKRDCKRSDGTPQAAAVGSTKSVYGVANGGRAAFEHPRRWQTIHLAPKHTRNMLRQQIRVRQQDSPWRISGRLAQTLACTLYVRIVRRRWPVILATVRRAQLNFAFELLQSLFLNFSIPRSPNQLKRLSSQPNCFCHTAVSRSRLQRGRWQKALLLARFIAASTCQGSLG